MKIHISKRCKEILDGFGSFVSTLRGDVQVKVGARLQSIFRVTVLNNII